MNDAESIISSSAFNVTDRLQIFSYLVSSNRVRWYRIIMRVFLQRHRELYRYQLTAQEVRDAVRDGFDPDYTLEQCQSDLAALKDWGNIITFYDSSRATSISSFLSPALLYQATPAAIAVETFLDEQARASANSGALRQGDLPRLWESLQKLDEELAIPIHELTATHSRAIAEEWQRAFEVWNTMAREAAQYLANMINAAQQARPDLEAFQLYKAAVVAYVHGFAQALTQYSPRIRGQLAEWARIGKQEQLIEIVARHLDPPAPTMENRPSQEDLLEDARNQIDALVNWFADGKNADSFRRNALAEVDKVVRRASVLASMGRPSANYAAQLNTLAQHLLVAKDGEAAQQLFSVAFANLLPIHLPESLAGSPSAVAGAHHVGAWQEASSVKLRLRPVNRSSRGNLPLEDPIIDNRTILRDLMAKHETRIREQRERFARLFAANFLDIGTFDQITPEDRSALLEVIDACLGQPQNQYAAPDGSTILLLNPNETAFTVLHADDGMVLLPRYRLERLAKEEEAQERDKTLIYTRGG